MPKYKLVGFKPGAARSHCVLNCIDGRMGWVTQGAWLAIQRDMRRAAWGHAQVAKFNTRYGR